MGSDPPGNGSPTVYLLCGISGSGKTSYAQQLEEAGCVRLTIDEHMWERFGRQGKDYAANDYRRLHYAVRLDLDRRMIELIARGDSVILDYGLDFWRRQGRDHHKRLIEQNGGRWELIYLRASVELLLERLARRRELSGPNAIEFSTEQLLAFVDEFEAPVGEGEVIIDQT